MLNLIALDEDDRELLENSFNQIGESSEIITDEDFLRQAIAEVSSSFRVPNNAVFSFQNLFKVTLPIGHVYIGQCLLDYGYPNKGKGTISTTRVYTLQIVGFTTLSIDLGNTVLRPENKLDKILGRFWRRWNKSIKFPDDVKFNEKYYLVSTAKEGIIQYFEKPFINAIARTKHLLITIKDDKMFITFANGIHAGQSKIIVDILKNSRFLKA